MVNSTPKSFPEVDVILLSWNRTEMTIETIESLLEQQQVDLKIWIVDQGSEPDRKSTRRTPVTDQSRMPSSA